MAEITPIPLAELTTLRTGAAPERMLDATTADELVQALREVWQGLDEWFVLGGGSNLFVGDEPFEGTVIRV
ncbi:MAG: UDP-N-acetylmuramate dehydrogenase, partial [Microbacteriaceae bacterium]